MLEGTVISNGKEVHVQVTIEEGSVVIHIPEDLPVYNLTHMVEFVRQGKTVQGVHLLIIAGKRIQITVTGIRRNYGQRQR